MSERTNLQDQCVGPHVKVARISLACTTSKLLTDIVLCGLSSAHLTRMPENQAGFQPGWNRSDHPFIVRCISEYMRIPWANPTCTFNSSTCSFVYLLFIAECVSYC